MYRLLQRETAIGEHELFCANIKDCRANFDIEACAAACYDLGSTHFQYGIFSQTRPQDCLCRIQDAGFSPHANANWDLYEFPDRRTTSTEEVVIVEEVAGDDSDVVPLIAGIGAAVLFLCVCGGITLYACRYYRKPKPYSRKTPGLTDASSRREPQDEAQDAAQSGAAEDRAERGIGQDDVEVEIDESNVAVACAQEPPPEGQVQPQPDSAENVNQNFAIRLLNLPSEFSQFFVDQRTLSRSRNPAPTAPDAVVSEEPPEGLGEFKPRVRAIEDDPATCGCEIQTLNPLKRCM